MATLSESSDSETEKVNTSSCLNWNFSQQKSDDNENDSDEDQNSKWTNKTNIMNFTNFKRKFDGENENISVKKSKQESNTQSAPTVYNSVVQNMMKSMGFKEGSGLGKYGQGRTQIIEASKQRGRRGLGLHLKELEPSDIQWDFSKEQVSVNEDVFWIPSCLKEPPRIQELRQWIKEDQKKMTIDDEDNFCDPNTLTNILACKSVFDKLEPEEMRRARTRSNPFETIRGVIFQNRAAVKMANIDAIFDFMFTDPRDDNGNSILEPHELLYFADICAGPGGFSEYILWRKKWEAKGFGFTLKGPNDFKLEEFFAGPPESFEPHYGVNGIEGDGNIYVSENLREFRRFVLENTEDKGVHFVMADGGFSVEGQENIQEILSKRLYLCQFLCALSILRTGGHFICKLFDVFTAFSVGLIYLIYRTFQHVCIHKPNTSRPANSERYIICKNRLPNTKDIHDYLYEVNCRLGQLSSTLCDQDVIEVVPLNMLKEETSFFNYIVESNNRLGEQQIIHLAKIKAFAQNIELYDEKQSDFRRECLQLWKLPDRVRSAPNRSDPKSKFRELIKGEDITYLSGKLQEFEFDHFKLIKSKHDYCCIVSGVEKSNRLERGFFLGLGRSHIFKWDGSINIKWNKVELAMELPSETLVYAEIVQELKGEGRAQRKINAMHLIDVLYLGGTDVRNLSFIERITMAKKLVKAVSKPSRPDFIPLRTKDIFQLEEIDQIFDRLAMKIVKGSSGMPRLCYKMEDERHFLPTGLFIIKMVEDPWMTAFSRTNNRKYFFNLMNGKSTFDAPKAVYSNFKSCFSKRLFWAWESGVKLLDCHRATEGKVHRQAFEDFVYKEHNCPK